EKATELDPGDVAAWFEKGLCLAGWRRNTEAIRAYDHVLDLDPACGAAYYERGYSLEILGRETEAAKCYEKARLRGYLSAQSRVRYHFINGYSFY
ncbi:MAG: tetratricopeptide repeat protein, partial [Methanoregulaceae archaeon]|nr:tetratricopeptide repeat protein [Methanoregulaceae archaeon]